MGKVALVTGASKGLGSELARFLAGLDYHVVLTARHGHALDGVAESLLSRATAVPGDVSDSGHRDQLVTTIETLGRLDLLVNNASDLGPTPLPALADYQIHAFEDVLRTNLLAPLALIQGLRPMLASSRGLVVNISSDAARGGYEGWGGDGARQAAPGLLSLALAHEPRGGGSSVGSVGPGGMRAAQ